MRVSQHKISAGSYHFLIARISKLSIQKCNVLYHRFCHSLICLVIKFISLVQFSRSVVSDSLQSHGLQHARPSCPSPIPGSYANSNPLVGDAIQQFHSLLPLLLPPSIFPSIRVFSNESALRIRWPKY